MHNLVYIRRNANPQFIMENLYHFSFLRIYLLFYVLANVNYSFLLLSQRWYHQWNFLNISKTQNSRRLNNKGLLLDVHQHAPEKTASQCLVLLFNYMMAGTFITEAQLTHDNLSSIFIELFIQSSSGLQDRSPEEQVPRVAEKLRSCLATRSTDCFSASILYLRD